MIDTLDIACPVCDATYTADEEHDCIRAAAEDSVEGQWRALRDAGADETTLRRLWGDR